MSAVDDLNQCLVGSPYLLESDEMGSKRADFLATVVRADSQRRHDLVTTLFNQQSREIRARLEKLVETRVVYESNRLERAGLPLAQTQQAIEGAPTSVADYSKYLANQAVRAWSALRIPDSGSD